MKYTIDFYKRFLLLVRKGDILPEHYQEIADLLPLTNGNTGAIKSLLPRVQRALSGECCIDDRNSRRVIDRIRQAHYELGGNSLAPLNDFSITNGSGGHKKLGDLSHGTATHESHYNFEEFYIYHDESEPTDDCVSNDIASPHDGTSIGMISGSNPVGSDGELTEYTVNDVLVSEIFTSNKPSGEPHVDFGALEEASKEAEEWVEYKLNRPLHVKIWDNIKSLFGKLF